MIAELPLVINKIILKYNDILKEDDLPAGRILYSQVSLQIV